MNEPSLRLFFALWPDPDTRAALRRLQAPLQGRLTHYADLHLTLAFLGAQPQSALPLLKEVLAHLPRSEIRVTIDKLGYFSRNRIAWAGTHASPEALLRLQQQLVAGIGEAGVQWKNEHAFKSHITLARDASPPGDIVFAPFDWRANEVALVLSENRQNGARYQVVAARRLDQDLRWPDPGEDARLGA